MVEPTYTKAYVVVAAVVLVVAGVLIALQFRSRPETVTARIDEGVFICEACTYQWKGTYKLEPRDFYIVCRKCGEQKARVALECPRCHRNFLPPFPEHDKPLSEMSTSEFETWHEEYERSRKSVTCPYCGALVESQVSELEDLAR